MKKKSQLYGQVFVYILTLILISFILIYGYNSIQNFKSVAKTVSCLKLRDEVKNSVSSILSDFGSVKIKNFRMCEGYNEVCFAETFEKIILPEGIDPLIKDSILSETGDNAFLASATAKESFYIGNISVEPDVFCIKAVSGQIRIMLEGAGNHVILSSGY